MSVGAGRTPAKPCDPPGTSTQSLPLCGSEGDMVSLAWKRIHCPVWSFSHVRAVWLMWHLWDFSSFLLMGVELSPARLGFPGRQGMSFLCSPGSLLVCTLLRRPPVFLTLPVSFINSLSVSCLSFLSLGPAQATAVKEESLKHGCQPSAGGTHL